MNSILFSAKHPLLQLKDFLPLLKSEEYALPLPILSGSTVGMHIRHILEFYTCLIRGICTEKINYDARERQMLLETDREFAMSAIDILLKQLMEITLDGPVRLISVGPILNTPSEIETSIFRELHYVTEHAIHHMAIIKMACVSSLSAIDFHQDFGVAYSTIKHRDRVHSYLSS